MSGAAAASAVDGRTALVTGASSGIGRELAKRFARDGYALVLSARRAERLAEVADECRRLGAPYACIAPADLAQPDGVERLLETVGGCGRRIDVLVNDAGFGGAGAFADTCLSTELEMIQVNVTALTHLTKALLPDVRAAGRGRGAILNVSSTAGFQPGPYMAVYYATKAYVLSFTEALAEELAPEGIRVTTLCPGPTATGFAARAGMQTSRLFHFGITGDAASVAEAGYRGLMRGQRIVVPGLLNRLMIQGERLAPRRLVTRLSRELNARRVG